MSTEYRQRLSSEASKQSFSVMETLYFLATSKSSIVYLQFPTTSTYLSHYVNHLHKVYWRQISRKTQLYIKSLLTWLSQPHSNKAHLQPLKNLDLFYIIISDSNISNWLLILWNITLSPLPMVMVLRLTLKLNFSIPTCMVWVQGSRDRYTSKDCWRNPASAQHLTAVQVSPITQLTGSVMGLVATSNWHSERSNHSMIKLIQEIRLYSEKLHAYIKIIIIHWTKCIDLEHVSQVAVLEIEIYLKYRNDWN